MDDQNAFVEKVEKIAAEMRDAMRREEDGYPYAEFLADMAEYVRDLDKICARSRPRPTLADMTDEERFSAVGTWADVDGFHPYRAVIGGVPAPKVPVFKPTTGSLDWVHPEDVTPLPELGRAWNPGGSPPQKPAPAPAPTFPNGWRLADHEKHGLILVTNTTPNRLGNVYFVAPTTDYIMGYDCHSCDPDELTYLPQEASQ